MKRSNTKFISALLLILYLYIFLFFFLYSRICDQIFVSDADHFFFRKINNNRDLLSESLEL